MSIKLKRRRINQKGFTLVELLVVIAILGTLAAIAVPRFGNSTIIANTAKVAADLRTIDSAISMHLVDHTETPTVTNLVGNGYLAAWPAPPAGKVYIGGTAPADMPAKEYTISPAAPYRGMLNTNYAEDFHK